MKAAAALSEHPLAAHAVGEVAGSILERLDEPIEIAFVFIEAHHTGVVEDIASSIRELLAPNVLIGATACGVLSQATEVEDRGAVSVWAASGLSAHAFRIEPGRTSPEGGWSAFANSVPADARAGQADDVLHVVSLVDPFTAPALELLHDAEVSAPFLRMHGGFASAAQGPGGNRLVLDEHVFVDGAVGVALRGPNMRSIVSQGCRPIGDPFVITGIENNVITELGSEPPLVRLQRLASEADDSDRELMAAGLHIGVALDESVHEFRRGDFLVRGVLGADGETGALAIGAEPEVGTTVQFHVRDAQTATEDLAELLDGVSAQAALTFTCNGRGVRLFGIPGHDAEAVHTRTGSAATAGMFCAGELGPVAGKNHLHGFTASTLIFEQD